MTFGFIAYVPTVVFGASYPCNFDITSEITHITYEGENRNNPDGTYYPGDGFHYIAKYSGLESCSKPIIYQPSHSNDLILGDHVYEDEHSIRINSGFSCGNIGCTTGHAEINTKAKIGSAHMAFSSGGWRVICHTRDGSESCTYDWISKTHENFVNIVDPKLALFMHKKFVNDSDGYNATNMDGTHYLWDPITVYSVPSYKWKNERSKTLFVEYEKYMKLDLQDYEKCTNQTCVTNFSIPGFTMFGYNATYGDDVTVYNATEQHMVKNHIIRHKLKLLSVNGNEIKSKIEKIPALVVEYAPIFKVYPYLVLADSKSMSWDNRHGVAMFYAGSKGLGSDDEKIIHGNRRSKINDFSSTVMATKIDSVTQIREEMYWSDAYGVKGKSGYCTKTQTDPSALESVKSETAMFVHSGYGSLIFQLSISDIMKDPLYSYAHVNASITSRTFAGNNTEIFKYVYVYPDVLFGNNISLTNVDADGNIINNIPVSIDVTPNLNIGGVSYTHDYMCDKAEFDTGDRKIGDVLLQDMYPKKVYKHALGNVTLYLPRMSTWNSFQSNDFMSMPIHEAYGMPSPYVIQLSAGQKTVTRTLSYSHIGDHAYIANQDTDNILSLDDNRAGIVIRGPEGFGRIQNVRIDGLNQQGLIDCLSSCILTTPKNPVLIEAYNVWGGRAYVSYEPVTEDNEQNYVNWHQLPIILSMMAAVLLTLYLGKRLIHNVS